MRDISARELKGHNILAVERFQDNTRRMIEFSVLRSCAYGSPGDEMRLFLTEDGYQTALHLVTLNETSPFFNIGFVAVL